MDYNTLTSYIEKVYEIESQFYTEKILIKNLRCIIKELDDYREKPWFPEEETSQPSRSESVLFIGYLSILGISILLFLFGTIYSMFHIPIEYIMIIMIRLISIIIVLALVISLSLGVKERLDSEAEIKKQMNIFRQELKAVKAASAQTKKVLHAYYSVNIVARKYRNITAISSFCEYLLTGRTRSLSSNGMDQGAYHIFENELRLHTIVKKPDKIIYHLSKIKDNQRMLYCAINESNRKTDKILYATAQSAQKLESIEQNTVLTAFNNAIAASNAEYLKWIKTLNL